MRFDRLTEFSIYLDQRPGELAGVLGAASAAGVDVTSVSTAEHGDRGCVRLLGTPEDALRHVCESLVESGIGPVVEAPVLAVSIENRPNLLRELAVALADHRLNVRYCYTAPAANHGTPARCIFRFDDTDAALAVLEKLDWPAGTLPGESAA
jgi:hypothetical protein